MSADAEFTRLAQEYLDDRAERHPTAATDLGDHRFDDRLADPSEQARADERRSLDGWAARLAAMDDSALSAENRVDAAMMAGSVARRMFEIDELREHTWVIVEGHDAHRWGRGGKPWDEAESVQS